MFFSSHLQQKVENVWTTILKEGKMTCHIVLLFFNREKSPKTIWPFTHPNENGEMKRQVNWDWYCLCVHKQIKAIELWEKTESKTK